MKSNPEIVGLAFTDRMWAKLKNYEEYFVYAGIALLSLLLSNSVLFAQIAPFGIALTAAVGSDYTIAAVLGAVIGYLIAPDIPFKMKYIAAILVIGAVKWALSHRVRPQANMILAPILSFLALGATGASILMAGHPTTYDFILLFSEILLASGATFFFSRTLSLLDDRENTPIRQSDLSCFVITFGLLIVALCSFKVGSVSIGHVAGVIVILICALKAGEAGGAIGGIAAGVAVCLSDSSFAFLMGSYGFGGLLSGVFSRFGRFGCAAIFIVINGIATALAALARPTTLGPVIEVFIASVVFVLLPPSLLKRLTLAPCGTQFMSTDSIKNIIINRLYFTKKALGDVSSITEKVSEKLQKLDKSPFDICTKVSDRVCKDCPQRTSCWQEGYNTTAAALNDISALLRRGKAVDVSDIPEHLRHYCPDPQSILDAVSTCCDEQRRTEAGFARNMQLRSIVLDQWSGIEKLISDISDDISRIAIQDEQNGRRVREYLSHLGIRARALSCYEDEDGHILIELSVSSSDFRGVDKTDLAFHLSDICERDFSLPATTMQDGNMLLVFHERASFRISHGVTQVCSTGKRLCGDSFKLIEELGGKAMVILSDGMGNGSLAAIDSSMATALISRLVIAGVGLEATLKLVNSAMLIKSGDESLATVDICDADLYKGSITLYKAGAAPSYVKKSGRVGFIESSSLPAGILNSVEFQQTTLSLSAGDVVVMVSDGVTQTGEDWLLDELERYSGTDMQWLCERISSLAKLRRTELHDDDITVFAFMLHDSA